MNVNPNQPAKNAVHPELDEFWTAMNKLDLQLKDALCLFAGDGGADAEEDIRLELYWLEESLREIGITYGVFFAVQERASQVLYEICYLARRFHGLAEFLNSPCPCRFHRVYQSLFRVRCMLMVSRWRCGGIAPEDWRGGLKRQLRQLSPLCRTMNERGSLSRHDWRRIRRALCSMMIEWSTAHWAEKAIAEGGGTGTPPEVESLLSPLNEMIQAATHKSVKHFLANYRVMADAVAPDAHVYVKIEVDE